MNVLTAGEASVVWVVVRVKSVNVPVAVVVVNVGVDESVAEVESELVSVGKESVGEVKDVGEVVSVVRGVVDKESVVKLSVAKLLVGNVSVVKVSVVDESVNVVVGTSVVLGMLSVVIGILSVVVELSVTIADVVVKMSVVVVLSKLCISLRMDAAKNKLTGSTDVPQPIVTVFVLVFVVVFVTVLVHPVLVYVIGQSDLFGDAYIGHCPNVQPAGTLHLSFPDTRERSSYQFGSDRAKSEYDKKA
ncbi:hypothetical protein RhiLY_06574 [Ceratobasidium sp. AG-Ba]|nr:hypothetical protein RhiLY_06574 [Ceratobasidium sp. AG-Ba]